VLADQYSYLMVGEFDKSGVGVTPSVYLAAAVVAEVAPGGAFSH
jgi:hypothetical protein